jgi:hypothetical protein
LKDKERQMGLGSLNTVGLSEAREEAERCRKLLKEGKDPIEVRRAERAAQQTAKAKSVTFEWCATEYMKAHEAGWRNAKHRQQLHNTLNTCAYRAIGKLPVRTIDTGQIMQILTPIWIERNETASRVRGRIEKILDWARVNGHRTGENAMALVNPERETKRQEREFLTDRAHAVRACSEKIAPKIQRVTIAKNN